MGGGCRIRAATSADLAAVAEIERASFPSPWSVEAFRAHLEDVFLVAESPAGIAGYVVAWSVGPEAEILNVAVAPPDRGRGMGRTLLGAVVRELESAGARRAFLEVRVSNAPARRLYERAGFVEVGRRRDYYDRPREDALILACDLPVGARRA